MDDLLGSVILQFIHDDIFIQIMAYPHWLLQIGICKEIRSEKQAYSKYNRDCDDNQDLMVVILFKFDIGIDVVVVIVGNYGDSDDRD